MPARPFLLVLALSLVACPAPLMAQRLIPGRFPVTRGDRIFPARLARTTADTGVAANSAGSAAGGFVGAVFLGASGSGVGFVTGVFTAMGLGVDGDAHPVTALAVILPQSALLAGAGGCAAYHRVASCRPIFLASALGAVGGAVLAFGLIDSRDGAAQALTYFGVHTLAVAGAVAREKAEAARQKAAP